VAHPEGARPAIPGAKSERQAAGNAGALSFTLADAEIEALDQATTRGGDNDYARSCVQPAGERPVPGWPGSRRSPILVAYAFEPQEGPMAEEPTVPSPLDAIDLESLSDDELRRLTQLLMSERERRMGLEPGPEDPL
jgi:hypothetical protein